MNRQKLILFILLIVLALAAITSYFRWPRQKTSVSLKSPPAKQQAASSPVKGAPATTVSESRIVRLDLLDREPVSFKGYRRNIFKPVFVDEVLVMKQKAAAVKPLPPPPKPPPAPPAPPAPSVDAPQRELARFTFLGFLTKDNRKTIFLSKDKDIILVKKGDVFAGRYEASVITDQALTIQVKDTGEQIVIPLIENRPLAKAER